MQSFLQAGSQRSGSAWYCGNVNRHGTAVMLTGKGQLQVMHSKPWLQFVDTDMARQHQVQVPGTCASRPKERDVDTPPTGACLQLLQAPVSRVY